jgi:hypothetical protein
LRTGGLRSGRWLVIANERIVSIKARGVYYEVERSEEELREERRRRMELEIMKRGRADLFFENIMEEEKEGKEMKEEKIEMKGKESPEIGGTSRKEGKVEAEEDVEEEESEEEEDEKEEQQERDGSKMEEEEVNLDKKDDVEPKEVKVSNEHRSGSVSLAPVDIPVMNQASSTSATTSVMGTTVISGQVKEKNLSDRTMGSPVGGKPGGKKENRPAANQVMDEDVEEEDHCRMCGIVITKGRIRIMCYDGPVHVGCTKCICQKTSEEDEVNGDEWTCKACGETGSLDWRKEGWNKGKEGKCAKCKKGVTKEQVCFEMKGGSVLHVECKKCPKCGKFGRELDGLKIVCKCGFFMDGSSGFFMEGNE